MIKLIYHLKYIITALVILPVLTGCGYNKQHAEKQAVAKNNFYYTCSMHPQVHENHPGNCPVCSMKLIKVQLSGNDSKQTASIRLTSTQIRLAGIQTDTVREENTGAEKTVTGTVTANENNTGELSARLQGRIQRLFIRTPGEVVNKGQPVYTIYSEDLLEAEKELLLAKEQQQKLHNPDVDYPLLIKSAENKLKLWGLSSGQIAALGHAGEVSAAVTITSTVSGTVSDIGVHEGDYVTEGMTILKVAGLSMLWVEAQLYAGEADNYKLHDPVTVSLPNLNGMVIKGRVDFVNPELSNDSKVELVRVSIANANGQIRPGMQAYISFGGGGSRALAVPSSAVITGGRGNLVWVKNGDGSFSARVVELGEGNNNYVQVLSGVSRGEVIVTSGAYLLNSEAIFRNGSDQGSMAGMKM
ncbi:MAG TPA: efflux RND transporter periplasmic adaptor subunit [Mucilaginibacter sp.]